MKKYVKADKCRSITQEVLDYCKTKYPNLYKELSEKDSVLPPLRGLPDKISMFIVIYISGLAQNTLGSVVVSQSQLSLTNPTGIRRISSSAGLSR